MFEVGEQVICAVEWDADNTTKGKLYEVVTVDDLDGTIRVINDNGSKWWVDPLHFKRPVQKAQKRNNRE